MKRIFIVAGILLALGQTIHPAMKENPFEPVSHPFGAALSNPFTSTENPFGSAHTDTFSDNENHFAHPITPEPHTPSATSLSEHTEEAFHPHPSISEPFATEPTEEHDTAHRLPEEEHTDLSSETKNTPVRLSTLTHNASIATIHVTAGHTHTFAPLTNTAHDITGYFIQDTQYRNYLSHTTDEEGDKTTVTYTLTIPHDALSGTCTLFEGHGSLIQPKDLQPRFHIEIAGAPEEYVKTAGGDSFKIAVQKAWEKQEASEQAFFDDIKKRFEDFRSEVRAIWSNINQQDGQTIGHLDEKLVTKEPLTLYVGETKTIACSKGGSIESSDPMAVSVKLSFTHPSSSQPWDFIVTANAAGKSIITYTMDGTSYTQPIIAQQELTSKPVIKEEKEDDKAIFTHEDAEKTFRLPTPLTISPEGTLQHSQDGAHAVHEQAQLSEKEETQDISSPIHANEKEEESESHEPIPENPMTEEPSPTYDLTHEHEAPADVKEEKEVS